MKYAVAILRFIRGYVTVCATGGFPERFINLCYSHKINLWDISLREDGLFFRISRSDFLKLRGIVKKSGIKITIASKTGLVYQYRKYNKRSGLITGTALFLAMHLFLSMFVWCTDVKGNSTVSKTEILLLAEKHSLAPGVKKRGFDEIRAARSIASEYKGKITWLSINIKGSLAVIELREDNRLINKTENRPPCNIVADFDGVIISAETYYGDCMVKKGIGVKKGDLLINGAIINEDTSTTFYASKGKITALHEKEINFSEKVSSTCNKIKINSYCYNLGLFGKVISLGAKKSKNNTLIFSERRTLNINGYNLPFFIEKILICEKVKTQQQNQNIRFLEKTQNSIYKENANSTVTEKNEKINLTENGYTFKGKYTLIDYIGEEKPILSENSK